MITIENSRGFSRHANYPVYEYLEDNGKRRRGNCDGSRIEPLPQGYTEVIHYQTIEDDFAAYVKGIEASHRDIPNQHFIDNPNGIFIGRGRNARWIDEMKRRGLS